MNTKHTLLHLSLIDGVGACSIAKIIAQSTSHDALHEIYMLNKTDLMQRYNLSAATALKIETGLRNEILLENELNLIDRYAISWNTILCTHYPSLLKHIDMSPPIIYWQGTEYNNEQALAFVGSRKANQYGYQVINQLVPPLIEYGYTIISGGALGADSMAHRSALDHGGNTVVVLGSGLLRPSPPSNRKLFEEILSKNGTIMSTFALQTEPFPANFPARNRIISGLSKGTVVIQAAARSGTSITAQYALEQGREVFAVPGPITDALSAGCHSLIAQGATITTHAHDILTQLGHDILLEDTTPKTKKLITKKCELQVPLYQDNETNISGSTQERILHACRSGSSTDDLMELTQLDRASLNTLLFELQLAGKLQQNFMGMWILY